MGNCMETKRDKQRSEESSKGVKVMNRFDINESDELFTKINENGLMRSKGSKNGGGMRVKVVVTKEELQWLMSKLNNSNNGSQGAVSSDNKRSIEEVLSELEHHGRKRVHAWKPSLDSIPEVLETHT